MNWESLLEREEEKRLSELTERIEEEVAQGENRISRITSGAVRRDTPLKDLPQGVAVMKTSRGLKMILGESVEELSERTTLGAGGRIHGKAPKAHTEESLAELENFHRAVEESPLMALLAEEGRDNAPEREVIEAIQERLLPVSVRTPEELREGILSGRLKSSAQRIYDRHAEIRRRIFMGHANKDIARDLDVSPQTVSAVKNNPLIQEQLRQLHIHAEANALKVQREIQRHAPRALEVLTEIMNAEDTSHAVRLKAAADLLDRAGHKPIARTETSIKGSFLDAAEITALKSRALAAARDAGVVIDAELVEALDE